MVTEGPGQAVRRRLQEVVRDSGKGVDGHHAPVDVVGKPHQLQAAPPHGLRRCHYRLRWALAERFAADEESASHSSRVRQCRAQGLPHGRTGCGPISSAKVRSPSRPGRVAEAEGRELHRAPQPAAPDRPLPSFEPGLRVESVDGEKAIQVGCGQPGRRHLGRDEAPIVGGKTGGEPGSDGLAQQHGPHRPPLDDELVWAEADRHVGKLVAPQTEDIYACCTDAFGRRPGQWIDTNDDDRLAQIDRTLGRGLGKLLLNGAEAISHGL